MDASFPIADREAYLQKIATQAAEIEALSAKNAQLYSALTWWLGIVQGAHDRLHAAIHEEMPASIADKLGLERTADGLKVRA